MKDKRNKSLDHRLDNRTEEQGAKDFMKHTSRENIWGRVFKLELESAGYKVDMYDNGIDNTGKLIRNPGKNIHKVDMLYILNGVIKLPTEFKARDSQKPITNLPFITFKTGSLRDALAVSGIVLIPDRYWYMILRSECIKKMLEEIEPKIYKGLSPNDLAIRVWEKDYPKWIGKGDDKIELREWKKPATMMIEEHVDKLFGRR